MVKKEKYIDLLTKEVLEKRTYIKNSNGETIQISYSKQFYMHDNSDGLIKMKWLLHRNDGPALQFLTKDQMTDPNDNHFRERWYNKNVKLNDNEISARKIMLERYKKLENI